ncbi:2-oxoglutarate and iron-dependent oxygenase JMJD4 isoform X2 [Bacillus rossius redtenbacheri]|uniref:2-oxoglutarate and iron-dependent oxygenase JMJD4 isoform X2 n=1 Tax=Bacillus rossius redtenbacheri TaxID=93214 RepID=UPI002FDD3DC6
MDWHFTKDYPEENVYRVPQYFASDWLNEYLCNRPDPSDDYRFVYMGPKGSWTPFHADVFTSFSWSVNVCGRKKWWLFPPGEEACLRDRHGQLAYDASAPELKDNVSFPNYHKLGKYYEVEQKSGEAIFVPSGWHHQVWNLEDTISINHNWVNGCNIDSMWKSLKNNLAAVKKEVEDCKEMDGWEEHCQVMLRATYGINYREFFSFLHFIAKERLRFIEEDKQISLFGDWLLGKHHAVFDLKQLKKVLDMLIRDSDAKALASFEKQIYEALNLSSQIELAVLKIKYNR